jgi:hypothetical protein
MANYLLVYHGGSMPESPEEGAKVTQAWTAWFGEIGSALVDGGNPASATRTIASNGSVSDTPNGPSGYSIIKADSLDAAVGWPRAARSCTVARPSRSWRRSRRCDQSGGGGRRPCFGWAPPARPRPPSSAHRDPIAGYEPQSWYAKVGPHGSAQVHACAPDHAQRLSRHRPGGARRSPSTNQARIWQVRVTGHVPWQDLPDRGDASCPGGRA